MILTAHNLSKVYQKNVVLCNINLSVKQGEMVAIIGKSGAGKSTLLHLLSSLDNPDKGEIYIENQALHKLKGNLLAQFRNQHIGIVFQFHHLLPEFSVIENICIPGSRKKYTSKQIRARALNLLSYLGLEHKEKDKPNMLSGGEQQRVAVARALINNPSIIFADEPSGSLDEENAHALHQLFLDLKNKRKQTFVIATHNMKLAQQADRVYTIENGSLV